MQEISIDGVLAKVRKGEPTSWEQAMNLLTKKEQAYVRKDTALVLCIDDICKDNRRKANGDY